VLAGELKGPSEALEQFNLVQEEMAQQDLEPSPEEAKLLILLQKLYQDYQEGKLAGPSLTDSDRELLVQNLGWCGKLALAPRGGPDPQVRQGLLRSTRLQVLVLIGTLGMVALFGLFGFFGLVVLLSFLAAKRLRPFMSRPLGYGGVYAEGFAVYMVVFLGLGLGESLLPLPRGNLWLPGLNMLLALGSGLAWPVLRGIPWPQVRRDLGLTLGRKPALEGWIGLGGYALTIPIFVLGTLVTLVLVNLHKRLSLGGPPQQNFAPIDQPSHPIIDWVSSGNSMVFVQIVVLAVILAPLVEETMFRGMLYRHLREATTRWGRFGSFLASASLVSLLFAGIHPQGWKAVPALMGLALGMNLLREWRGSLLPSMMVHGIHNGLMTLMLIVAVQG
jgi:membrane protease YdiL (CAAX protease family)